MSPFFSRAWTTPLLVGLAAFVFLRGVVPGFSRIDADFPGYFTAARIAVDGRDVDRLYDDVWFREQMHRYGTESPGNPGKFAPFPPPTALLMMPLARLEPLTALRIVTAVSVLCLVCSMFLLARILSWDPVDASVFVLLSGIGILSALRFGQPYILISMCCILGYFFYLERRPWLAGVCFGLFMPVKYFPVIMPACLALQKEWRVVLGSVATVAGVALASIAVLGWKIHEIFLSSILGKHLAGRLSLQDHTVPFTAVYQSFDTLFDRLFVLDPVLNPRPLWVAPQLATFGLITVKVIILLAAIATLVRLARARGVDATAPSIGILGILVLLIAPATATYMFVLLWLPVALIIGDLLARQARVPAYLILALYALIGFIPYNHFYPFEGRGGLTVLAFPRLLLLLAMFIVCVWTGIFSDDAVEQEAPLQV